MFSLHVQSFSDHTTMTPNPPLEIPSIQLFLQKFQYSKSALKALWTVNLTVISPKRNFIICLQQIIFVVCISCSIHIKIKLLIPKMLIKYVISSDIRHYNVIKSGYFIWQIHVCPEAILSYCLFANEKQNSFFFRWM